MKVRVIETGDIIEISTPYIVVKNGMLFNNNTGCFEAVGGDVVTSERKDYHITKGQYTDSQILPCEEAEPEHHCVVLSAEPARHKTIRHINHVEMI